LYLCDALLRDEQFQQTIKWADELLVCAKEHNLRGHSANALSFKGRAFENLGQGKEALDLLRQAMNIRRTLSVEETHQQQVDRLEAFLEGFGTAARRFGQFEEAIMVFGELSVLQAHQGNLRLQAQAISDIGYTYLRAGEQQRAVQYLQDAALIAQE